MDNEIIQQYFDTDDINIILIHVIGLFKDADERMPVHDPVFVMVGATTVWHHRLSLSFASNPNTD